MTVFCWGCCIRVENYSGTQEVTNPDVGAERKASAENWNTNGYSTTVNARLRKLLINEVIGGVDDRGPIIKPLKPVSPPIQQPDKRFQSP